MGNIYEIIGRAVALQNKTDIGSITAEETGGIMADTLRYLNDYQLSASSIGLARIYSSLEDMQSDQQPTSDLNGMALKAGQLAVIVSESEDEAGKVYRYNGMPGNWTYVGIVGSDVIARNINEYNLSLLWPTDGSEGTNVYTKDLAVSLMTRKLSPSLLVAGITAVYLTAQGTSTVLRYTGGDSSSLASWMEVQDFTADASKKLSEAQPAVDTRLQTQSKEIVGAINEIFRASGHQNQQSDWNETDPNSKAYIRNKPDVLIKGEQKLSEAEKKQVKKNLGIDDIPKDAVLYTPQNLTPEQEEQARENIGAIPDAPSDGKPYVRQNGVWGALENVEPGSVIVDSELSETSSNAIQNQAVAKALKELSGYNPNRPASEQGMGYVVLQSSEKVKRKNISDLTNEIIKFTCYETQGPVGAVCPLTVINDKTAWLWGGVQTECSAGDKFFILGSGGTKPRLWCFIDAENHILSVAKDQEKTSGTYLVAPEGAVKLIVNMRIYEYHKFIKIGSESEAETDVIKQSSFSSANTIYEIQSVFSLSHETIELPENSVLFFNGGKLTDGVLKGAATVIECPTQSQIFDNLYVDGDWKCLNPVLPEWFGAQSHRISFTEVIYDKDWIAEIDSLPDSSDAINNALLFSTKCRSTCNMLGGIYRTTQTIFMPIRSTLRMSPQTAIAPYMEGEGTIENEEGLEEKVYALPFNKYISSQKMATALYCSSASTRIEGGGCILMNKCRYTIGVYLYGETYWLIDMAFMPTFDIKVFGGVTNNTYCANTDSLIGQGAPGAELGEDTNTYLDTTAWKLYKKISGNWNVIKDDANAKYNVCFRAEVPGGYTGTDNRFVNLKMKLGLMYGWRGLELTGSGNGWHNSTFFEGTISNCLSTFLLIGGISYCDFSNMLFQVGTNMNKDSKVISAAGWCAGCQFGTSWDVGWLAGSGDYPRYYFGEQTKNNIVEFDGVPAGNIIEDYGTNNAFVTVGDYASKLNEQNIDLTKYINLVQYRDYSDAMAPRDWAASNKATALNRYSELTDFETMRSSFQGKPTEENGFPTTPHSFWDDDRNTYYDIITAEWKSACFALTQLNGDHGGAYMIFRSNPAYLYIEYAIVDKTNNRPLKDLTVQFQLENKDIKTLKNVNWGDGFAAGVVGNALVIPITFRSYRYLCQFSADLSSNPNAVLRIYKVKVFAKSTSQQQGVDYTYIKDVYKGKTVDRPNAVPKGFIYFDTDLQCNVVNLGDSETQKWGIVQTSSVIEHGTANTTAKITPGVFHVWDEVTKLTPTLATADKGMEFKLRFVSGTTPTNFSIAGVKWASPLSIESGKTYEVSVVDNLGLITSWVNE